MSEREDRARELFQQRAEIQMAANTDFSTVANNLREHYLSLDNSARRAFVKNAVRMYANYENKWTGHANINTGQWIEPVGSGNDVNLTVPLLAAHVDTDMSTYTGLSPDYNAVPFIKNEANKKLADMCVTVAKRELDRMMRFVDLQHEAQYLALATVSYRKLQMDYRTDSPVVFQKQQQQIPVEAVELTCNDCGYSDRIPMDAASSGDTGGQLACPECARSNISANPVQTLETVDVDVPIKLPRPILEIPNPINVQRDWNASSFDRSKYVIQRRRIPRKTAEYYYQMDFAGANTSVAAESVIDSQLKREPIRQTGAAIPVFDIGGYVTEQNEMIEEVQMWLDPCEYGLLWADGANLAQTYPEGLYILMVGDLVVRKRPCRFQNEWIGLQQGVRPNSNTGTGRVSLADMNDVVNNCLSLDYAVLRTHGFPLRILREKYLSILPQATQTLLATKIPDDVDLQQMIHTEPAAATSGMVGVLPGIVGQHMQFVAGSFNPLEGNTNMQAMLGNATGAAALETMLKSRQSITVQARVDADMDTMFAVLYMLKQDQRNRLLFLEEFDEATVDKFFVCDFRGTFYFKPVRGTDEPQAEATNAFKMITFAQNVAPLTGMHQFDPESFYDLVGKMGDALQIDVAIGAGRKERNLATNKIVRVKELYKQSKDDPMVANLDPIAAGFQLYRAVTMRDMITISSIAQASQQLQSQTPIVNELQAAAAMTVQAPPVEIYLYDWEALTISYRDWLQSDEGQNSAIPIQVAIGMLFSYAQTMKEQRESYERFKMLSMIPPPEDTGEDAGGSSGSKASTESTKKDGKAPGSTGRPRQLSASRYAAGKTRETD